MTENFSIFGFQRASCRERNPTSEKRNPVSRKINSETEGGNAAKNYEKRRNWISTRVKWLCNLWPFQPVFVLLGGTKHNSHNWKHILNWIENLNWILRLAEKQFQCRKIIHEILLVIQKNERYVFRNKNLKRCFEGQRVWLGRLKP